jgi:hypothetical protein
MSDPNRLRKWAEGVSEDIFKTLQCLIVKEHQTQARNDIRDLMTASFQLWDTVRKDNCRIVIDATPPAGPDGSWNLAEIPEAVLASPTDGDWSENPGSFAIFPQVTGRFGSSDDLESDEKKPEIIHPGTALFSDSPIFAMGKRDFEDLKAQLQQQQLAHARKSSISSPTKFQFSHPGMTGGPNGRA